ncbi:MAG TPA: hypothetical protein VFN10_04965 [Thermoanaerobaculia bacterium]|nr:hypothetical protein [Thermoanaerobaculia bacterium]
MQAWAIFLISPAAALIPAAVFLILTRLRFRSLLPGARVLAILPVIAWIAYAIYEWRMQIWSRSVIAPIRIDLLIIVPILLIASLCGAIALTYRPRGAIR